MKRKRFFSVIVFILFMASCVTINIYFPAAAVQKAADKIVEDVRGIEKKQEIKPQEKQESRRSYQQIKWVFWGPSYAYAQIDIEISTPAIRAIKESLKDRFPLLKPFYDRGSIGENNTGFLEIRDTAGLNLKEKAEVAKLVDHENEDRKALYSEIMRANKFGPEVLPQIQKIFANSWREKSQTGWWTQDENNEWKRKK